MNYVVPLSIFAGIVLLIIILTILLLIWADKSHARLDNSDYDAYLEDSEERADVIAERNTHLRG